MSHAHPIFRGIGHRSSLPGGQHVESSSPEGSVRPAICPAKHGPTPVFRPLTDQRETTLRRQPSLRSQLNQIRLWVRQGRTDAWIAHKLDVSSEQLERFKRDHDLEGDGGATGRPADPLSVPPPDLYEEDEDEPEEVEEDEEEVGTLIDEPEDESPARAPRRDSRRRSGASRNRPRERDRDRDGDRDPDRDRARSRD